MASGLFTGESSPAAPPEQCRMVLRNPSFGTAFQRPDPGPNSYEFFHELPTGAENT